VELEVVGKIAAIEIIAVGAAIRELPRLQKSYGKGRWRKLKWIARVRLPDGALCRAEVHWYKAHGIGRKELKIKYTLED
jgi:hypothetical protein